MQCYQYLAAITAVSNTIDSIPDISHHLPQGAIAYWMAENDIEAEDVLYATPDELRLQIESLSEAAQTIIPKRYPTR